MSNSSASPSAAVPAAAGRIRVLIIDDSALVRRVLTGICERERDMLVVGAAPNPLVAREMIRATNPDVITLDIEMPQMDGLDFLEKLMRLRPTPVVMVSTLTERGSEATLRALELGAIDFVAKPKIDIAHGIESYAEEITNKIRVAAKSQRRRPALPMAVKPKLPSFANSRISSEKLIVIGASTGGTEAIKAVLERLPADSPAVLIAQHMPPGFTRTFAARLNSLCKVNVAEAVDGQRILPGHAYIAPGGFHLKLGRSGANYVAIVDDTPPVNRHRPSVDALFHSVAEVAGRNALGVMLTGMGRDGANGMREMKVAGSYNIAQDEASCVVFGMPKEAIAAGAVDKVMGVDDIAGHVVEYLRTHGGHTHRV